MKTIQSNSGSNVLGLLLAAQMMAVGCGPAREFQEPSSPTSQTQGIRILNGISANGISANGISANGISANGISANGLTPEGVNTADFTAWFQTDPERNDTLMRYMVRCGARPGQHLTYTDPTTATSYTWEGLLGLTPEWTSGMAVTEAEQQVMTACLAAHVNKYGLHVSLSVLGQDAQEQELAFSQEELATYSRPEGCFFGNLFTGEGFFVGTDGSGLAASVVPAHVQFSPGFHLADPAAPAGCGMAARRQRAMPAGPGIHRPRVGIRGAARGRLPPCRSSTPA